jgi:coenzyme F420 hydrogenase subunit delta
MEKRCLVFGCGNSLLGDDGFGVAVVDYIQENFHLPEDVACIDAGTAVRDMLFDILLSPKKPQRIIIIDAADQANRKAGEIFEIGVGDIHPAKIHDFSLHQFPTTNMLGEIKEGTDVDVRILVVQVSGIPDVIAPGLSEAVKSAVPEMGARILKLINGELK